MQDLSEPEAVPLASVHMKSNACRTNGRIQPINGLNGNTSLNASPVPRVQGLLRTCNVAMFVERFAEPDPEKVFITGAKVVVAVTEERGTVSVVCRSG